MCLLAEMQFVSQSFQKSEHEQDRRTNTHRPNALPIHYVALACADKQLQTLSMDVNDALSWIMLSSLFV